MTQARKPDHAIIRSLPLSPTAGCRARLQGLHACAAVYLPLLESAEVDAPLTLAYWAEDSAGPGANFVGLTRKVAAKFLRRAA